MNKAIRRTIISLVLATGSLVAVPATPAHACTGDVCDGFCLWWNQDSGTPVDKFTPGDCPIR